MSAFHASPTGGPIVDDALALRVALVILCLEALAVELAEWCSPRTAPPIGCRCFPGSPEVAFA